MSKPNFETMIGKDGKHYWRLNDANGEIILAGRGFKTKSECIHAIASVMHHGGREGSFLKKVTTTSQHYFQLKAPSGKILGWSEMYHSQQGRDNGISQVRRAIQSATVNESN